MEYCTHCGQPIGRPNVRGGRAPYGFKYVDGVIAAGEDDKLGAVIWAMREHRKGVPYRVLADILNAAQLPSPTGGRWSHTSVWRIVKQGQRYSYLIPYLG